MSILLNGEEYNLLVANDFSVEEWSILGASSALGESGMAAKELRLLEEGDVITTIWQLASYSGDDDFEKYAVRELTVMIMMKHMLQANEIIIKFMQRTLVYYKK